MKEFKAVMGCVAFFVLILLYGIVGGVEQGSIEFGKACFLGGILCVDALACLWICTRKDD